MAQGRRSYLSHQVVTTYALRAQDTRTWTPLEDTYLQDNLSTLPV